MEGFFQTVQGVKWFYSYLRALNRDEGLTILCANMFMLDDMVFMLRNIMPDFRINHQVQHRASACAVPKFSKEM